MEILEFIFITIALVILISFIANRIISKKNVRKKQLPKDEDFIGNPNNLDKIIEGVSLKDKEIEDSDEEKEEINEEKENDNEEEEKIFDIEKNRKKTSKKLNLKDAMISDEILNRKY